MKRNLTPFEQGWLLYTERFGLQVEVPFVLDENTMSLEFPVLLKQFGAPRGMLLVEQWEDIAPHETALVEGGFGYSCLSLPTDNDALSDVLRDWGWSSPEEPGVALNDLLSRPCV